ncbi:MAG: hypothetical protein QXP84_07640 [Candidatus Korarchaeum sp.]
MGLQVKEISEDYIRAAIRRAFPRNDRNTRSMRNEAYYIISRLSSMYLKDEEDLRRAIYNLGYSENTYLRLRSFLVAFFFPEQLVEATVKIKRAMNNHEMEEKELRRRSGLSRTIFYMALYRLAIEGFLKREANGSKRTVVRLIYI